ncbi:unnamed protein product [Protopolystoma xenopodis]|uniref:Roc domain-containing protein n=1 Tax=Protopolystoma xenopodis TaxID=117903 RepID=A0A448WAW8_9PLAT|nr:unnamed protein product [Protopolystoma xenopodis]
MDVQHNPLNWPPATIANLGMDAMLQYYYETKIESKSFFGAKCLFVGAKGAGKSSLAMSIVDSQSRLTDLSEEITHGIDIRDIIFDASGLEQEETMDSKESKLSEYSDYSNDGHPITLSIWDCSGNPSYRSLITHCSKLPAIVAIIIDLSKYPLGEISELRELSDKNLFYEQVGYWLDMLLWTNNHIVALIVGNKADLCNEPTRLQTLLNKAFSDSVTYANDRVRRIAEEIYKIESLQHISPGVAEQYRKLVLMNQSLSISFYPSPLATTCVDTLDGQETLKQLCRAIIYLAAKTPGVSPFCLKQIPSKWADAEAFFAELTNENYIGGTSCSKYVDQGPLMSFEVFASMSSIHFSIPPSTIFPLAQYLHDIGKAYWPEAMISRSEHLNLIELRVLNGIAPKQLICVCPSLLLECISLLVRCDLSEVLDGSKGNKQFLEAVLNRLRSATGAGAQRRLKQAIEEIIKGNGILGANLWTAIVESRHLYILESYLPMGQLFLQFIWLITSDSATENVERFGLPSLLFPCRITATIEGDVYLNSPFESSGLEGDYDTSRHLQLVNRVWQVAGASGPTPICLVYKFPIGLPEECFLRASFNYIGHWHKGVQMWHSATRLLLRLTQKRLDDGEEAILFEVRALTDALADIKSRQPEEPVVEDTVKESADGCPGDGCYKQISESVESKVAEKTAEASLKRRRWRNWPISIAEVWDLILPVLLCFENLLSGFPGRCAHLKK